jgi:hypothetical protein
MSQDDPASLHSLLNNSLNKIIKAAGSSKKFKQLRDTAQQVIDELKSQPNKPVLPASPPPAPSASSATAPPPPPPPRGSDADKYVGQTRAVLLLLLLFIIIILNN